MSAHGQHQSGRVERLLATNQLLVDGHSEFVKYVQLTKSAADAYNFDIDS
jgi:hypothetical protein